MMAVRKGSYPLQDSVVLIENLLPRLSIREVLRDNERY